MVELPEVCLSMAAYPGLHHDKAVERAYEEHANGTLSEPLLGALSLAHVQLVPQSFGVLDESTIDQLRLRFPLTQFRLHANVRVLPIRCVYDLSNFSQTRRWFERAAALSQLLGAQAYSAHAGYRANATLDTVFDAVRACQDLFGHAVAIEGLYPDRHDTQWLSTWNEYARLLVERVPYALDLSHLNIVAKRWGRSDSLVQELLDSPYCIEVHVSANDGRGDQHQRCDGHVWWARLLAQSAQARVADGRVVFSEGNRRKMANARWQVHLGQAPDPN